MQSLLVVLRDRITRLARVVRSARSWRVLGFVLALAVVRCPAAGLIAVVVCIVGSGAAVALPPPTTPPTPRYLAGFTYHNNVTVMPPRGATDTKLLVLIHGWRDNPTMWAGFRAQMGNLPAGWVVWEYDWREDADQNNYLKAVDRSVEHVKNLARMIVVRGRIGGIQGTGMWDHVHFVSHSLGAAINEGAAGGVPNGVRNFGVRTTQQTFLDPALDDKKVWRTWFGRNSEVSENYFATGPIVFTGQTMTKCVNVETRAMSPYITRGVVTNPVAHHKWPVEWYGEGITGTARVPQSTYGSVGWGLSKELFKSEPGPVVWPPGGYAGLVGELKTLDAAGAVASTSTVAAVVEEARTPGVTVTSSSGGNLVPMGAPVRDLDMAASGSERAWALLNVDTSSAGEVNALKFDFRFPEVSQRAGVLSFYVTDDDDAE